MRTTAAETRRDRRALAREAGLGSLSLTSAVAGMLSAFGAFAVLAAIAAAVLQALGIDSTDDISGDWRDVGVGTGIAVAVVAFVAYLFGGYVAGRMARRAGASNGLLAFGLGLLVVAGVAAAIGTQADTDAILDNLRSVGVPTSSDEWQAIGSLSGAGAIVAMLLGALLGGALGERWHGKLVARAADPSVGPEVDLRDHDRERGGDAVDDGISPADTPARDTRFDTTLDEDRASLRGRPATTGGRSARARDGEHFASGTPTDQR